MSSAGEWPEILRVLGALAFVLALMGGLVVILRRLGYARGTAESASRRLKLVEVLPLDARRRLALIRRDDVEHLVILGVEDETVVETGIRTLENGS